MSNAPAAAPVIVYADQLTPDEVFTLEAIGAYKPGATLDKISEFRSRAFAMSRRQQLGLIRSGVESLVARGLLAYEYDKDGRQVMDADGSPVFVGVKGAKVVARLREYQRPA